MHCHQGNLKTTISYPPLSSTTAVCLQLSKKHVCLHSSINSRQGYLEFVLGSCDFLVMSKQQNRRARIFFCKYLAIRVPAFTTAFISCDQSFYQFGKRPSFKRTKLKLIGYTLDILYHQQIKLFQASEARTQSRP